MVAVDINDVVREVVLLIKYETDRRGVSVTTELATDLPPIVGDRVQLQQVLLNLIMNGLDAMTALTDRPRVLQIRSLKDRDSVMVQVEDSGAGWDPRHQNLIFDPFFTTKKDGIGMGLTISRSIVERHGGRLWAERRKPEGAILNFTLPMAGNPE
jgi:C4-dicarboxylate-specific signal transduction histidine kinase